MNFRTYGSATHTRRARFAAATGLLAVAAGLALAGNIVGGMLPGGLVPGEVMPGAILPGGVVPAAASTTTTTATTSTTGNTSATGNSSVADVNDFSFESFSAVYTLTRDDAGRSLLTVEETLVATFPDFDQNRGIRRELVERYDGRPTDISIVSITDDAGNPRAYETESNDEFVSVTIAGDEYVRGTQVYVITYVQHNVTRFFDNTGVDEFYWDTNGTGWQQNFGRVTARLELDPELTDSLTGDFAAYVGYEGSKTPAPISQTDTGFLAEVENVQAYENLTFSVAFEPGTFTPRDSSFTGAPWPTLSALGALGGLGAVVAAASVRRRKLKDAPGRGTIIPEYTAPKNANIPLSSVISKTTTKVMPAQIVGLAVAGNIRVLEAPGSGRKPTYVLQFITAEGAGPVETEFLHALFGASLDPGEDHALDKADTKAGAKVASIMQQVTKDATTNGYRRALPGGAIALVCLAALVATAVAFGFGIMALDQSYGGFVPGITLGLGVLTLFTVIGLVSKVPLDAKGTELREYLLGLKMYIELAEADRLNYLQSPQGAERSPVATGDPGAVGAAGAAGAAANAGGTIDTGDPMQLLKLNEKLLPYAVLFGLEKQWTAELGKYYEQTGTQPTWYSGSSAFNAGVFAAGMSSLSSSVSSSFSSSSGGSGGGGSSGGGGGGGGGGGV